MEMVRKLLTVGAPQSVVAETGTDSLFMSSKCAMITQGSWMIIAFYTAENHNDYAWALLPYADVNGNGQCDAGERYSAYNGLGWAASAAIKNPDAAYSLISYFCSKEGQLQQSKLGVTMEYCGDVINFKTYSKSFKNKTRLENPVENWAIFKDVHEPIIDRDTFERVQKLVSKTKRRAPKPGNAEKSMFSDLLYCADCGKKLWFGTNTINRDIHFFSCSNYEKDHRGSCKTRHYIRADSLEQIVMLELRQIAEYLRVDEEGFAELLAQKTQKDLLAEKRQTEAELQKALARNDTVLKLYEKVYEDNAEGKVSDEWFMQLSHKYEVEKLELKSRIASLRTKLTDMDNQEMGRENYMAAIRKFMEMDTLTAPLLRELIDHITVYETEGTGKNRTQRVVIHYNFVGYMELPDNTFKRNFKADTRQGVRIEYLRDPTPA